MNTINKKLKESVKQKYNEIALQDKNTNTSSCCGSGCCSTEVYNIMSEDYRPLTGYNPNSDLGLGCGLPTQFAKIKEGDTVIDLGSGAGNDCFVARAAIGETGWVLGIDFTPAMIHKARINAEQLGFNNVEFRQGDIEALPVTANSADVVISNCVLNLVPDKEVAFKEIYRILKPGGHFSISDVVLKGLLPDNLKNAAEMYAGCISDALQKSDYIGIIEAAGFKYITIQKEKPIMIPDDILINYLATDEINHFKDGGTGIYSLTIYAEKTTDECCAPGCCKN